MLTICITRTPVPLVTKGRIRLDAAIDLECVSEFSPTESQYIGPCQNLK